SSKAKGYSGGAHGYDNAYPDMHGIFYAKGEAFKKGYEHNAFQNVELYGIICKVLGLHPQSTDGDLNRVKSIFRD
ncbi:MAG: alkaline phosphatase family protein, partial [Tenuifilaceae bacterium]|nr:alkaline phosphatase family protein [Tenuifilaceae bacterium]